MKVTVVVFSSFYDEEDKRSFIEAAEGELVFLVRNKLNYWPKFQNEIHFSNQKGSLEIAEEIFEIVSARRVANRLDD